MFPSGFPNRPQSHSPSSLLCRQLWDPGSGSGGLLSPGVAPASPGPVSSPQRDGALERGLCGRPERLAQAHSHRHWYLLHLSECLEQERGGNLVRRVDAMGKELAKGKERGDRGQRWTGSPENHFRLSRTIHTADSAEIIFNPGLGLTGRDGTKGTTCPARVMHRS